jgi:hypothetical protein
MFRDKCRSLLLVSAVLAFCAFASIARADTSDSCSDAQVALKDKIAAIENRYKAKMQEKKTEYDQTAKQIQRDADESQPTTVGAILKFDVKVDWKDTTLVFDTPTVTLNQTRIILGLPDVTLNQQKWVYDLPATRIENQKVGQHPEITCDHALIPSCTVEWKDNIVGVPVFYMERHETILGVPEFALRDQTIIFGVPAITMQRQQFILGLPQITVTNVNAEVDAVQSEASAFQHKAEMESTQLAAAMKTEIRTTASNELHGVFQCERVRLETNRSQALSQIDTEIAKAKAAAQAARDNHADASAKTADAVVAQIVATRAAVNAEFDDAAKKLNDSERDALNSFVAGKPGTPTNNVGRAAGGVAAKPALHADSR